MAKRRKTRNSHLIDTRNRNPTYGIAFDVGTKIVLNMPQ